MMVLFVLFLCLYIYKKLNIYDYGTKLWFFFICSFAVGRIINPVVYKLTGAFALYIYDVLQVEFMYLQFTCMPGERIYLWWS